MFAAFIAYLAAAFLLIVGIFGLIQVGCNKYPKHSEGAALVTSAGFIIAAWLVARIAGI